MTPTTEFELSWVNCLVTVNQSLDLIVYSSHKNNTIQFVEDIKVDWK